jgi:hypothetical protein
VQYCQATSEVQGSELGSATRQYCQTHWQAELGRIGRQIGRSNDAQLGSARGREPVGARMQNWEWNWGVQRCNIVRRIGRQNDAELGTPQLRFGRTIGRCKVGELAGELAGAKLGVATRQNRDVP